MKIIIGLSNRLKPTIFSRVTKWHQKSNSSHAFISFYSGKYKRQMVYEASQGQVRFITMDNWLKTNGIYKEYTLICDEEKYNSIITKCIDLAGTIYGFLTILGIALNIQKLKEDGARTFICTELVVYILKQIGIYLPDSKYNLRNLETSLDYLLSKGVLN